MIQLNFKLVDGQEISQFVDSDVCLIGRSPKCDVVIPQEGMSRQHCKLEVVNGEVFVTDLGSTNGVYIDGKRITPNKRVPYALYLTLAFGIVQSLQIQLEEGRSPAPKTPRPQAPQTHENLTRTKVTQTHTKPGLKNPITKNKAPLKGEDFNRKNFHRMVGVFVVVVIAVIIWWNLTGKIGYE